MYEMNITERRLRVLLIRKDFKPHRRLQVATCCLRVLLIRKDFKRDTSDMLSGICLRVLLIRKDFKLLWIFA